MARVTEAERAGFFAAVAAASKQAIWAALATADGDAPRVRIVHPTWEGETVWLATGTGTPKQRQIARNDRVELQWQVAPPGFVHVCVRGRAAVVADAAEKARVWDVIDYDLGQFWPSGPSDPSYTLIRVDPERVELSELFGSKNRRIWRRR